MKRGIGLENKILVRIYLYSKIVETNSGCWEFQGPISLRGYGDIRHSPIRQAHRLSYYAFCGPLVRGLVVTHDCDNRVCINPKHLKQQTYAQNSREMMERGRGRSQFKEKSVCKRGHDLLNPEIGRLVGRKKLKDCVVCRAMLQKKRRALKRMEHGKLSAVENNDGPQNRF